MRGPATDAGGGGKKMERLTTRDANCADPKVLYGVWVKNHDYISAANRLADYEDTGLTPEEVSTLVKDWSDLRTIVGECGGIDRVRKLAEADKAGRLAVLPCKVGDTLWVTGRDNVPREMELEAPDIRAVCTDEDNLCMSTCNRKPDGFCAYRLRNDGADIGKTVFLTREEADKALEAMKDV